MKNALDTLKKIFLIMLGIMLTFLAIKLAFFLVPIFIKATIALVVILCIGGVLGVGYLVNRLRKVMFRRERD